MNTSQVRRQHWQQEVAPNHSPQKKQVAVKVRKHGWVTKGEKILYSIVAVGLLLMSYYFVTYSSSTDSLNREIQSLEQQIEQTQLVNESLSFEVKELSKPDRIKEIAEKYGLKIQNTKVKRAHVFNNDSR